MKLEYGRNKAFSIDYDYLDQNFTDTDYLWLLSDKERTMLLSLTDYFRWSTRWENLSITNDELQALVSKLDERLMSPVMACVDAKIILSTNNQILINQYINNWDGSDPQSVNPNTPALGENFEDDGSPDRDMALCMAVKTYVESFFDSWIKEAEVVLTGTIISIGLLTGVLGLGIVPILAIIALASISQIALDAAKDSDARDAIICCMVDGLTGATITHANFQASLGGCGFTPGTNEAIIRDLIASDLSDLGNWTVFLNALGDAWILAQAGVEDCPACGDGTWSVTYDFTVTNGGFARFSLAPRTDTGIWVSGTGWVDECDTGREQVGIFKSFTNTDITEINFVYDLDIQSHGGDNACLISQLLDDSSMVETYNTSFNAAPEGTGLPYDHVFSSNADEVRLWVCPDLYACNGGVGIISSVTIKGLDPQPPEL